MSKRETEGCHIYVSIRKNDTIRTNYLAFSVEVISAYKNKDQKIQNSLRKIKTKKLNLNPVYT